jgi:hypothetical protein
MKHIPCRLQIIVNDCMFREFDIHVLEHRVVANHREEGDEYVSKSKETSE